MSYVYSNYIVETFTKLFLLKVLKRGMEKTDKIYSFVNDTFNYSLSFAEIFYRKKALHK